MLSKRSIALVLTGAAVTLATSATGSRADSATDWYIELKRVAKYARISAQGGARGGELHQFAEAASILARKVLDRDTRMPTVTAETTCMSAVRDLEASLKWPSSYQVYDAIVAGEDRRDRCLLELQRR